MSFCFYTPEIKCVKHSNHSSSCSVKKSVLLWKPHNRVEFFDTLQLENSAEHAVGHREGHPVAYQRGQTSARLRQTKHVLNNVSNLTASKDSEVKESSRRLRSRQCVKQTNHHEGKDILQFL